MTASPFLATQMAILIDSKGASATARPPQFKTSQIALSRFFAIGAFFRVFRVEPPILAEYDQPRSNHKWRKE